ncbi:formimidoylglutamate deiminase [Oharaeibacter diazotrophicus]|uniref:Formimidoylglutamate deiminase n=2 Tax=Oharaeibacter diazotrophicus TaxID=1920512 RepID=A0A4R6RBT5_9HYPH|nr:formimidoylglutamate deiminase [Oharaeibacter diazotrophicus]TDP83106.1 formimidoylglutamate deiminase [Oharaeibacter diazotrophicus]BBE71937.1 8-oxoguanine deaminase [Pleomorphomonas sp. SM30]GLS78700.1 formimidoylglutamate deiminase [Oharaeibacter diazotrophicus]
MTDLHFAQALLPTGWAADVRVRLADRRIAAVVPGSSPDGCERHPIALPGLASLHSHAFQRGMAGLAEHRAAGPDSFWTWRRVMYDFALALDPHEVEAIAAMLDVELLESGFTTVGEFHYLHHDRDGRDYADPAEMAARVAAAAAETGVGLTLLPVFYARSGFGAATTAPAQRRFAGDLDRYARLLDATRRLAAGAEGLTVGVAPHSLRAASREEIRAVAALGAGGPVHVHVAEQTAEVDDCLAFSGARPVAYLLDGADVDARWCLIHATHMDADEYARVAASGAVVGLCPVTEANLGDGIFDLPRLLAAGGGFGVGTDGNVAIGAAEELRQLEYSQRLALRARNVACEPGGSTGRRLFDGALAGGAAALGRGPAGLAVGATADIVGLDADHPALVGAVGDRVLDRWIFAGGTAAVATVWARGRKVVADGRHLGRDAVAARYRKALAAVLARL